MGEDDRIFKPGDKVESIFSIDEQISRRNKDEEKAKKLGKQPGTFIGNAASYMHTDEAYVVESITETGGLRLRGFAPQVSPNYVRLSAKPTYR
jgi:hypothetical protein